MAGDDGARKDSPAIVARLNEEVVKALRDANVRTRFAELDTIRIGSTAAKYRVYLKSEIERWSKAVKSTGVRP